MPLTEHMCWRCSKCFKTKQALNRHLNKKNLCRIVEIEDDDIVQVNTDDVILNQEIDFPDLPMFDFQEKFEGDKNYAAVIAAIRRSGKTTMIRHIYPLLLKNYDIVLFISNSIHNPVYNFVTGPRFPDHSPQMFKDIMKFQRRTGNMFRICVVLDDCISVNKKNDNALLQFFVRGRNSNITIMLSSQSPKLINKNNRGNSDFVIIGNNPSAEFREDVIKSFLNGVVPIPKFVKTKTQKNDYINQWILYHTKNYGFVILDNVEGKIYKFKTPF